MRTATTVLAWVIAAFALVSALNGPGGPLAFAGVAVKQPALTITGDLAGLQPGVPEQLPLRMTNPGEHTVVVHVLTARVLGSSVARCPAGALDLSTWRGRLDVPARGSATASLTVELDPSAHACRGVSWQLAYTAK